MIVMEPYIPLALWLTLAIAAGAILAAYAFFGYGRLALRRWCFVLALMTLAVSLPLALLLNPTWVDRLPPPAGKPQLTILVDRTASMNVPDVAGMTRFQAASRLASATAAAMADRYDVAVATFAESSTPTSLKALASTVPKGAATDIARALNDSLEDRPEGQVVLLLSDGADNGVDGSRRLADAAEKARAMAVPVFTKTFGGAGGVSDIEISVESPQELAFVAQQVPVTVRLKQRGSRAAQTRVVLRIDDKQVESRVVPLVPNGDSFATFQVAQERPGLYRYRFQADPGPEEATLLNNQTTLLVRVVDEPVRVLLLEGKPYWDTKFLVRTLAADRSIELDSVVRLAEGRILERNISRAAPVARPSAKEGVGAAAAPGLTKKMPAVSAAAKAASSAPVTDRWRIRTDAKDVLADPKTLGRYQIVVLGREADAFLTEAAVVQLKKWLLEHDGSLICFRGPPAAQISRRLGELMPVRWSPAREERFRVQLSESGRALRWLGANGDADGASLAGLPSLSAVDTADQTKPLAVVLASAAGGKDPAESRPVIAYQPVGNGRVVVVEGAGMWRWAFLPPEYKGRDAVYGTLWRSLMRWLVSQVSLLPSQRVGLRTDKVTYDAAEPVGLTLLVHEDQSPEKLPDVELVGGPLDKPRRIAAVASPQSLRQFRVPLGLLPEGEYRARVVGASESESAATVFDVRGNLAERLETAARPDLMKMLSQRSGGSVIDAEDTAALGRQFDKHMAAARPERSIRLMAWDRWWVLSAVALLWGLSWGFRRRSGLV